jgi:hypothetical protein
VRKEDSNICRYMVYANLRDQRERKVLAQNLMHVEAAFITDTLQRKMHLIPHPPVQIVG